MPKTFNTLPAPILFIFPRCATRAFSHLTGGTTLKKLQDNGIDPTQCDDQGCHLQTAQNMTVPPASSGLCDASGDFIGFRCAL